MNYEGFCNHGAGSGGLYTEVPYSREPSKAPRGRSFLTPEQRLLVLEKAGCLCIIVAKGPKGIVECEGETVSDKQVA